MATQTSYTTTAPLREDLENVIYNVSPTETPILSSIAKVTATAVKHEWQTDTLASAVDTNAAIEGADAVSSAASAPTRLNNYCQIFTKSPQVSGTYESVSKAGTNGMASELVKKGLEMKRDIETSICANKAYDAGAATVARVLAGIPAWLTTNTSAGSGGADPVTIGATARTDASAGNRRAFTEDLLAGVIQSCWDNGGQPDTIYVGSFNKRVASGFSGNATKFKNAEDGKIMAAADIYVSDFGELKIVPNRFMRSRDALVVQSDMLAFATMPGRNMKVEDLAKTGDSLRKQIITEGTLVMRNESAHGIVADLTAA